MSLFKWLGRRHKGSKAWVLGETEDGVHVLPFDDLIEHEVTNCVCGPTVEPCPREDGSMGWLVTHHSLDGREASE